MDPHGQSVETLLDYIPEERIQDVIYFAPFDDQYPIGFNVMEDAGFEKRHLVVSGLMSAFKKIFDPSQWSSRMQHILNYTLLALLEYPDSTILDVTRLYIDKGFRKEVVSKITDPQVKTFWTDEFTKYTDRTAAEATPAIQNKVGRFTSNSVIRNIVGQSKSSFNLRDAMDTKKIFLVNLSKGLLGEENASLLGGMLTTNLYLAALSRADVDKNNLASLPRFSFYADEFQSIANESFADILAEARKYKLSLIMAHQYVSQMEESVRDAVFGNVGSLISFRVGPLDSEFLSSAFAGSVSKDDLINLGFSKIFASISVDGVSTQPFSAGTLPPIEKNKSSFRDRIIRSSRERYATPKAEIENAIKNKFVKTIENNNKNNKKLFDKKNNNDNKKDKNVETNSESIKDMVKNIRRGVQEDPYDNSSGNDKESKIIKQAQEDVFDDDNGEWNSLSSMKDKDLFKKDDKKNKK